jgi:hypothetical protein
MRKVLQFGLAVAASVTVLSVSSPAEAAVKWDGSMVEVINKLPSDWPVASAVNWLDQYTGSDIRIVKSCHKNVRRCITIKQGRLTSSATKNATGWSKGNTITIDTWKAKNVKPWKGKFGYTTKKYLIAHELAHQRYMEHVKSCNNVMNQYYRCNGHVPPLKLTTAQKKRLAGY